MRMDAQLASLRVKRRTRFDPLPRRVNSVMALAPVRRIPGNSPTADTHLRSGSFRPPQVDTSSMEDAQRSILDFKDSELSPGGIQAKKRFIQFD